MRLTRLLGVALGSGLLFFALSSGANAYDGHWRDRDRTHWRSADHWRHDHGRPDSWRRDYYRPGRSVVVRERPVVVERPVMVAPQPMYAPPMYNQGPSGLNLNFTIPLH